MGGWHTHWGPTTTLQLPPAMFCLCTCAHLHFWPDHCIWTCLSVPAIPAPRAVWPTTSPKSPPSSWLMHPLSAHHHLPSPSGTPCMHACMHSESSRISAFGCIRPSLPAILEDFFHHKPALVAPFILWLEYLLCAHHTHFPIFQLLGTHVDLLFCQPGLGHFTACAPPRTPFCAPLHTSAHLRTPLHTFVLHLFWACHPYPTFL